MIEHQKYNSVLYELLDTVVVAFIYMSHLVYIIHVINKMSE